MKNAVVYINSQKSNENGFIKVLYDYLDSKGLAARLIHDVRLIAIEELPVPDLVIVLGGDGSIMRTANVCAPLGIPILSFNLGRVGYMAELETDELELFDEYLRGNYRIEERMMLSVTHGETTEYALNDAVISNGAISKMVALELYCNEEFVSEYHADGLIVSTPTGSTAYSMSAGGPIIDPSVGCLLVTPVCSHSLTSRPIVFSGDAVLAVKNISQGPVDVYLTLDGGNNRSIPEGETVKIERSPVSAKLIRIKKDGFYSRLGKKLK